MKRVQEGDERRAPEAVVRIGIAPGPVVVALAETEAPVSCD